jgi:hypothetical protein
MAGLGVSLKRGSAGDCGNMPLTSPDRVLKTGIISRDYLLRISGAGILWAELICCRSTTGLNYKKSQTVLKNPEKLSGTVSAKKNSKKIRPTKFFKKNWYCRRSYRPAESHSQ